jgi:hypothetical protein
MAKSAITNQTPGNNGSGNKPNKEAACVAASGPSQGRKHPRRASAVRGLPHRNNMHVRCTKTRALPDFFWENCPKMQSIVLFGFF